MNIVEQFLQRFFSPLQIEMKNNELQAAVAGVAQFIDRHVQMFQLKVD